MSRLCAFAALLVLPGCIAPPALTFATLAADGFSLMATGKSLSDHALSGAMRQNCAMWRLIVEADVDAVCRSEAPTVLASAAKGAVEVPARGARADASGAAAPAASPRATSPATTPLTALAPRPPHDQAEWAAPAKATAATPAPVLAGARTRFEAPANRAAVYLVVGSFRVPGNAERLVGRLSPLGAAVDPAMVEDELYFRVLVGPYAGESLAGARAHLASRGVDEAWTISLCTTDFSVPPCALQQPPVYRSASLGAAISS